MVLGRSGFQVTDWWANQQTFTQGCRDCVDGEPTPQKQVYIAVCTALLMTLQLFLESLQVKKPDAQLTLATYQPPVPVPSGSNKEVMSSRNDSLLGTDHCMGKQTMSIIRPGTIREFWGCYVQTTAFAWTAHLGVMGMSRALPDITCAVGEG